MAGNEVKDELDTVTQKQIKKMCSFREDDFTKEIIRPLFQAMGYTRVDFNGGANERGKDLIATKDNPPSSDLYVAYVQSKRIKNSVTTKEAAQITQLIHQLRLCLKDKILSLDGDKLSADQVYLACPQQVSGRLFDEIRHELDDNAGKVQLLDGPRIINFIKKYKPSLLDKLVDIEGAFLSTDSFDPGNKEILNALRHQESKDVSSFYNDLSFFVGSIDSNSLMHLDLNVADNNLAVGEEEWRDIRDEVEVYLKKYSFNLLNQTIEEVEFLYKEWLEEYRSEHNLKLISDKIELAKQVEVFDTDVSEILHDMRNRVEKLASSKKITEESQGYIRNKIKELGSGFIPDRDYIHSEFIQDFERVLRIRENIKRCRDDIDKISCQVVLEPKYEVSLDIKGLESRLEDFKEKYFQGVKDINDHSLSQIDMKRFLCDTERALSFIDGLKSGRSELLKLIEFEVSKRSCDRVSISAHNIFETGHDIAVYGGAGVGKTTTLEIYVKKCEGSNKKIVYIPLNRVVGDLVKLRIDESSRSSSKPKAEFSRDLLIKAALISKKLCPTNENIELIRELFSKNPIVVLDGIDEIYSAVPEVISSISSHKEKYPGSQFIISSRDCVSYLNNIDFLGITLLPFTDDQLKMFVAGWFDSDKKKGEYLINKIIDKEIMEHIKTPLLATITCSLVEKGVDAPSSENDIYAERLRLLTGEYDVHKNVERQRNNGEQLRKMAYRLALSMHENEIRAISFEDAFKFLKGKVGNNYDDVLIDSCLKDLVDPCNLFIFDPVSSTYSFGHFRFQEHLVAEALRIDRSVNISELTSKDWWRGALCIYAQDADISGLIEEVYSRNFGVTASLITLRSMINSSNIGNKKEFLELLKKYSHQDFVDSILDEIDSDEIEVGYQDLDYYGIR